MEDRYGNMSELFAATREHREFRLHHRAGRSGVAIVAPHGGIMEPGTFEIADAIAGARHGFYCFEALVDGLHVTSHRFDDPTCLRLVRAADHVITVHGCLDKNPHRTESDAPDLSVAIGGLDRAFGALMREEIELAGFAIGHRPELAGVHPLNICNRGRRGQGVQLELTRSLRDALVATRPTGDGSLFSTFTDAVERAIARQTR
jgi:phage replication-related protein YjqB (UPF0714/DUF867 family)